MIFRLKCVQLVSAFIFFGHFLFAQVTAPYLRCISVDGSQITLDWVVSTDPLVQFEKYEIMLSIAGLPYVKVDSLSNRLQNSYTHVGAQFGLASTDYKYYIIARYNDGSVKRTNPSDTLTPITPNLTVNKYISGTLVWNPIHKPPLPSSASEYKIDRKFASTTPIWSNEIGTVNVGVEQYKDTVARCDDEVFYRIRLADNSGCESVSAEVSESLKKTTGPSPMTFSSVSINKEFGYTELLWEKHPEPETVGYIIFYIDANNIPQIIDTVDNPILSYKDQNPSRPGFLASQCYRIAPIDSCNLTQGATSTHCTMYLERSFDPCKGEVSLFWTPYKGWVSGVEKYEVFVSINSEPFEYRGKVDGSDTTFVVTDVLATNSYAFYITGTDKSGRFVSNSNLLGTKFQLVGKPQYIHLRSASVNTNGTVKITGLVDRKETFKSIMLYRGFSKEGTYKLVKEFVPESRTDSFLVINDSLGLDNQIGAFYYAIVIDDCDMPIIKSEIISTLNLTAKANKFDFLTNLSWNRALISDTSAVQKPAYYVYYGADGGFSSNHFLSSLKQNYTTHYFENDIDYFNNFCYKVQLIQSPTNIYPKSDTSYSNIECFKFEPEIEIPNAFTPNSDGINETWRPEIIYGEAGTGYLLQIFDQWGGLILETDDPNVGWDGAIEGSEAPMGSYIYKLKLLTYTGSEIHRSGQISLVR